MSFWYFLSIIYTHISLCVKIMQWKKPWSYFGKKVCVWKWLQQQQHSDFHHKTFQFTYEIRNKTNLQKNENNLNAIINFYCSIDNFWKKFHWNKKKICHIIWITIQKLYRIIKIKKYFFFVDFFWSANQTHTS